MTRAVTTDRFAPGARIGDYVVDREVAYEAAAIVSFATHVVLPRQSHLKVSHPGSRTAAHPSPTSDPPRLRTRGLAC